MHLGHNTVAFVQDLQVFMLASEKSFHDLTRKSSVDF